MDPPDHTRLRRTLIPDFTFRRIERMEGTIQRICDDLLDALADGGATRAPPGPVDPVPQAPVAADDGAAGGARALGEHRPRGAVTAGRLVMNPP